MNGTTAGIIFCCARGLFVTMMASGKRPMRPKSQPRCCFRQHRLNRSLTIVFIGVLSLILMEYHVHRRFLSDIYSSSPSAPNNHLVSKPASPHAAAPQNTTANNNNPKSLKRQDEQLIHKPNNTNFAIFYNIYLNPLNASNGIRIIGQQTRQFFIHSYHHDTPLYYNIIGLNYTKRFCPYQRKCQLLQYYPSGGEELTLRDLHEYCRQHRSHQVIYIHNKGSFSPHPQNEIKRKRVIHALSRPRTLHDKTCNVLTLTWEPLPHFHAQSNMWLAKCSYIAKLLPPKEYKERRIEMFRELLRPPSNGAKTGKRNKHDTNQCLTKLFNRSSPEGADIFKQHEGIVRTVGMGRYINEVWPYSHPDLEPCDADYTLGKPLLDRRDAVSPRFQHAWLRLPGRLWEYQYIYNQIPSINSSFFYDYFQHSATVKWPYYCRNNPLLVKLQEPLLQWQKLQHRSNPSSNQSEVNTID